MSAVPATVSGAQGEALSFAGEVLVCAVARAFAPGAPLELTVGDEALGLRAKTIGSRRLPDGRFEVRMRLVSLRREQREALARALPG